VEELNKQSKEHFTEQRWADFVRGLASDRERREIELHLETCDGCQLIANRLGLVVRMGASESVLEVPEDTVQRARLVFESSPGTGWTESFPTLVAELVSSTREDWQLAGVRSAEGNLEGSAGDRLLFRAGDYSVDLKVEPPSTADRGEIIGQISNDEDRTESLEGVLVQMVVLGRTIGETETNRFGEFLMDYPRKSATLRFVLKHRGQRIDLALAPVNFT
jgi:hypothetical protein